MSGILGLFLVSIFYSKVILLLSASVPFYKGVCTDLLNSINNIWWYSIENEAGRTCVESSELHYTSISLQALLFTS